MMKDRSILRKNLQIITLSIFQFYYFLIILLVEALAYFTNKITRVTQKRQTKTSLNFVNMVSKKHPKNDQKFA